MGANAAGNTQPSSFKKYSRNNLPVIFTRSRHSDPRSSENERSVIKNSCPCYARVRSMVRFSYRFLVVGL